MSTHNIRMRHDRLLGMIIGGYLGEALGAPFKYLDFNMDNVSNIQSVPNTNTSASTNNETQNVYIPTKYEDYNGKLEYGILHPYRKNIKSTRVYPVGSITDSSVFTNHLLSSLADQKSYKIDDILPRYLKMSLYNPMIDSHSRKVFNYKTINGYHKSCKIDYNNHTYSSLSRCSPLLIYDSNSQYIIDDINLSHKNKLNEYINKIYISSLRNIVQGDHKYTVMNKALSYVDSITESQEKKELNMALEEAKKNIVRNVKMNMPNSTRSDRKNVLHPFYSAYWSLYNSGSYKESMKNVLMLGGNTDTNMKVSGEMVGLYEGYTRLLTYDNMEDNIKTLFDINKYYLSDVENKIYIMDRLYEK